MAPNKRIILCCDGTWQSSNNGSRAVPSNVAKMSRAIKTWDGQIPQLVFYDAGVGSNMGALDSVYSGAFGEGLSQNVCESYNFLSNNFEEGDEIYIFGFSRGAYTARAIAGLVSEVGICYPKQLDQFWEMYTAFKHLEDDDRHGRIEDSKWATLSPDQLRAEFKNDKKDLQSMYYGKGNGKEWLRLSKERKYEIECVGVFDTVGSLGWPANTVVDLSSYNSAYGFHRTNISSKVKNAFHAVGIDEKRKAFDVTLWYRDDENSVTNLIQCWFPGVHINIGGGQSDGLKETKDQLGDLEGMANIIFAWMVDRVRESTNLKFNDQVLSDIVVRYMDGLTILLARQEEEEAAKDHAPSRDKIFRGWGLGPLRDSYSSQSWLSRTVGGAKIRTPGQYLFKPWKPEVKPGQPEPVATPVRRVTNEYIHPVVAHAWDPNQNVSDAYLKQGDVDKTNNEGKKPRIEIYDPPALTQKDGLWRRTERDTGVEEGWIGGNKGWMYVKKEVEHKKPGYFSWDYWRGSEHDHTNHQEIKIPEFPIPPEKNFKSLERELINWPTSKIESSDKKMEAQYKRAVSNLKAWDKGNGFA